MLGDFGRVKSKRIAKMRSHSKNAGDKVKCTRVYVGHMFLLLITEDEEPYRR